MYCSESFKCKFSQRYFPKPETWGLSLDHFIVFESSDIYGVEIIPFIHWRSFQPIPFSYVLVESSSVIVPSWTSCVYDRYIVPAPPLQGAQPSFALKKGGR